MYEINFNTKAVSSSNTTSSTRKFYVNTIESKVNGRFADRFGSRKDNSGYGWNTKANVLYMNLRFDKYNNKNFKLVLADNGRTVAVKHRKKGIIKSMTWDTRNIASKIAHEMWFETVIHYVDGSEMSVRYSANDIYNMIQDNPNIFRVSINVGNWWDGSRHDHGNGFQINQRVIKEICYC